MQDRVVLERFAVQAFGGLHALRHALRLREPHVTRLYCLPDGNTPVRHRGNLLGRHRVAATVGCAPSRLLGVGLAQCLGLEHVGVKHDAAGALRVEIPRPF